MTKVKWTPSIEEKIVMTRKEIRVAREDKTRHKARDRYGNSYLAGMTKKECFLQGMEAALELIELED